MIPKVFTHTHAGLCILALFFVGIKSQKQPTTENLANISLFYKTYFIRLIAAAMGVYHA